MSPIIKAIDFSNLKAAENWYERFKLYFITNKDITDDKKIAHYLTLIGEKDLLYLKELTKKTPQNLYSQLLNRLKQTNIVMIERDKFHKNVRNSNESLKEFNLRVCQQGAQCKFKNHLGEQLRYRLMAGINNHEI